MSGNLDYPTPSSAELTPGEQQIEIRILRAAEFMKNAFVASGEKNARVLACAMLTVLEHNPELSLMFETLCANFKARVVLRESRHLQQRQAELKGHI